MMHRVKILPQFFEEVLSGAKTFEVRENDRGYVTGDKIFMQEYDISTPEAYTGRGVEADIGFLTDFKQQKQYVVFSLLNLKPINC